MAASPRTEVLERLVLARSLLRHGTGACLRLSNRFEYARGVLLLHDAAEQALGAVADHLHAKLSPSTRFLEYYKLIEEADPQERRVPYRTQMGNLNTQRNGLKHQGIFPDPKSSQQFPSTVAALLEELVETYLEIQLSDLTLADLIVNENIRRYALEAEALRAEGRFEEALIALGYGMFEVIESRAENRFDFLEDSGTLRRFRKPEYTRLNFTVELLQHGADPYTYYRFRNLTPVIARDLTTDKLVHWWPKEYGHQGNWTEKNVAFCLEFFVDTAVQVQKTPPYEYELIPYYQLFVDEITSVVDEAVFWEMPVAANPGARTSRPVRFRLGQGHSVRGIAFDEPDQEEVMVVLVPTEGEPDVPDLSRLSWVAREQITITRRTRGGG